MSNPRAPLLVENTDCHSHISVHVKEVITDELRSFCIQELDDAPYSSHPDEMDKLKTDIKLEIEGECGSVNVSTPNEEYSNACTTGSRAATTLNSVSVAKLTSDHLSSFFLQANPNNGENFSNGLSPAHFLLSPSSTNGTQVTSAVQVPTNDRTHVQASVLSPYGTAIIYSKPDYKTAAIHYASPQPWSYPYVPSSSPVAPGSYIQPTTVSIGGPYQVVYGIPPNHIAAPGPPLYAPQVVIQPPIANIDLVGSVKPQQKEKKVHIKKPLNAFMLFMKEQRAKVIQECTLKESAAINQILGKMWHALDKNEQAKYYEMARNERAHHMQLYPSWSARDNYASKAKRKRKKKDVEGIEGETRKCRARYSVDNQIPMWCTACSRKRKNSTKFSDSNSMENGSYTSEGCEDYCRCETQANIITETLHKLLAKKEQFLSDPCPNSHESYTNSQSSEGHVVNSQDSLSTSRGYDSDQMPSDDEGTVLTSTSHPSIPEQELD